MLSFHSHSALLMRSRPSLLSSSLLLCGLIFASGASAQALYKWVDDRGVTHYSAIVPPTASKKAIEEMRSGRVVRRQEAQLTQEELQAREAEKQRSIENRRKERQLNARVRILHERYASLQALEGEISKANLEFEGKRAPLLALAATLRADIDKYERRGASNEAAQVRKQLSNTEASLSSLAVEERSAVGKLEEDRRLWLDSSEKPAAR